MTSCVTLTAWPFFADAILLDAFCRGLAAAFVAPWMFRMALCFMRSSSILRPPFGGRHRAATPHGGTFVHHVFLPLPVLLHRPFSCFRFRRKLGTQRGDPCLHDSSPTLCLRLLPFRLLLAKHRFRSLPGLL